uniref:RNase III domain-containing protein n=1 Tax=Attheya septentrionalis TaxID=420275 RepID=A0A7S2XPR3_9STRA|mmetsp:Transcript_25906/g.46939  ORF Transcript_25906/g.46939 Transcript_25906/m.46939 type:complete len:1447 (+) Transcript_25906:130-4470(+)
MNALHQQQKLSLIPPASVESGGMRLFPIETQQDPDQPENATDDDMSILSDLGFTSEEDEEEEHTEESELEGSSLVDDADSLDHESPSSLAMRIAQGVLDRHTEKDPISSLYEHYQKQQVSPTAVSIKQCFIDQELLNTKEGQLYWTSTFTCPLTGTVHAAGLPVHFLLQNMNGESLRQELADSIFGQFEVLEDGLIYFKTKKAAQKSAAVCALEYFQHGSGDVNKTMVHSLTEAEAWLESSPPDISVILGTPSDTVISSPSKERPGSIVGNDVISSPPQVRRVLDAAQNIQRGRRAHYSSWVNILYELGVTSSGLTIDFREKLPNENLSSKRTGLVPTQLCCVMSITIPIIVTVVGAPCSTKMAALQSAMGLVKEEVRRQLGSGPTERLIQRQKEQPVDDEMDEKEKIMKCRRPLGTHTYPLYPWANSPSQQKSPRKTIFYLYELCFLTKDGSKNYISDRMGLAEQTTTRLGILFPEDPANGISKEGYYQASFTIPGPHGDKPGIVRLTNRTVVDLSEVPHIVSKEFHGRESEKKIERQLIMMHNFNCIIDGWKTYGFKQNARGNNDIGKVSSDISLSDRTYLFVPLRRPNQTSSSNRGARIEESLVIEWNLLWRIYHGKVDTLVLSFTQVWLPFMGNVDLRVFVAIFGIISVASFIPIVFEESVLRIFSLVSKFVPIQLFRFPVNIKWQNIKACHMILAGALSGLVAFSLFLFRMIAPSIDSIPEEELRNRFLVQRKPANNRVMYVDCTIDQTLEMTARSPLLSIRAKRELDIERKNAFFKSYQLDMTTASFADYYWKRYGIRLSHPNRALRPVNSVTRHVDHDFALAGGPNQVGVDNEREMEETEPLYIIPELGQALPMPRDVLYMCRHAPKFMTPLERHFELSLVAQELREWGDAVSSRMHHPSKSRRRPEEPNTVKPCMPSVGDSLTFISRLQEATTVTPCVTYQRLEFLGDAVLTYFVAVNMMARNSRLQWDFDDLGRIGSDSATNKALVDAALRVGFSQVIWAGRRKWRNAQRFPSSQKRLIPTHSQNERASALLEYSQSHHSTELSDHHLSDVIESLLAVLYLEEINTGGTGDMCIGMLDHLKLPLPDNEDKSITNGWPWFCAMGSCLRTGYPFELDQGWKKELIKLGTTIYCQHQVLEVLEKGYKELVSSFQHLASESKLNDTFLSQRSKILLMSALFDDSLESEESSLDMAGEIAFDNSEPNDRDSASLGANPTAATDGLIRVALLRDTLFVVGNSSLCLCLTTELYQRYPDATAGDLHLLLTCAQADDVLVYVLVKNGIHRYLYDQSSTAIAKFLPAMLLADIKGSKLWEKRKGWILPGGIEEFRSRCKMPTSLPSENDKAAPNPRYVGLTGGRLCGHSSKLPLDLTEDLAFSMKAIVGALTLCLGLDGMWKCIGPLFDELMLLSADELRKEFGSVSSICRTYQRGHESTEAKEFR